MCTGSLRSSIAILNLLASHPSNKSRITACQLQLSSLAFSDDHVADLLGAHAHVFRTPGAGMVVDFEPVD